MTDTQSQAGMQAMATDAVEMNKQLVSKVDGELI